MERLTNKKILIVDDTFFIRYDLAQKLKSLNSTIYIKSVGSFSEGLSSLKLDTFDMIFFDLDLANGFKGESGIELLQFIKQKSLTIKHKFILSGTVNASCVKKCYNLEVDYIFAKPLCKEKLIKILRETL